MYRHYGFDFRAYAYASIRRRLWKRIEAEGLATISALQERVLHDAGAMERLLLDLSVNVTAMFRDPHFLPGVPRERGPAAAYLSVHPDLARRVFDGRRGVLDGDPARRRRARTTGRACTRRTSTKSVLQQARARESFRSSGCRSTRRTTSGRRHAVVLRVLHGQVRRRALRARAHAERGVLAAQPGHRSVVREFNVILCRNVLIYFDRKLQDPRAWRCSTRAWCDSASSCWAQGDRCGSSQYESLYESGGCPSRRSTGRLT